VIDEAREVPPRIVGDLQCRLDESLAQHAAAADVLKFISRSTFDLQTVLETLIKSAVNLCGANRGSIFLREGDVFPLRAASSTTPEFLQYWATHPPRAGRGSATSRVIASGKVEIIADVLADPEMEMSSASLNRIRAALGVPMLRDNKVEGVMVLTRPEPGPFAENQIDLVQMFADQAMIAIENTRLFNETQQALERQTATAEILKVIASSPADVQPVFDAIANRSKQLIGGFSCTVFRLIHGIVHLVAYTSVGAAADEVLKAAFPRPVGEMSLFDMAKGQDVFEEADAEDNPDARLRELARARGFRSTLFARLMSKGTVIGLIAVTRTQPGNFDPHHVELLRTFADQAVIAIENTRLFEEVQARTRELSQSLDDLRTAQDRLVQTEKLASLGQLTAGIAHEIKNPLNFVNNFSALSAELIDELNELLEQETLTDKGREELEELTRLLKDNLGKVVQHGKRADAIVKNMLQHSREGAGERRSVDINALVGESLNLAYHGARAEKAGFDITLQHNLDPDAGELDLYPQEMTRALLNLISNGFYAASKRKAAAVEGDFEPVLSAATRNLGKAIEIRIRDNGTGIPPEVREKMFNPFFTTKPTGEGTGLGLSMTHDIIVKQHGGRIDVATEPGVFTEFIVTLPRDKRADIDDERK
jgi:two-component system NtrC family sensor kinase